MALFSAGIIVIGDEILSGRTKDTNSNFIANHLIQSGIKLVEIRIIEDKEAIMYLNAERFYGFK